MHSSNIRILYDLTFASRFLVPFAITPASSARFSNQLVSNITLVGHHTAERKLVAGIVTMVYEEWLSA